MSHSQPISIIPPVIRNANRGERSCRYLFATAARAVVFVRYADRRYAGKAWSLLSLSSSSRKIPTAISPYYIASGGGSVAAGFAVHDTMGTSVATTIAMGFTGSMATFLLMADQTAGAAQMRRPLPPAAGKRGRVLF